MKEWLGRQLKKCWSYLESKFASGGLGKSVKILFLFACSVLVKTMGVLVIKVLTTITVLTAGTVMFLAVGATFMFIALYVAIVIYGVSIYNSIPDELEICRSNQEMTVFTLLIFGLFSTVSQISNIHDIVDVIIMEMGEASPL